MKVILLSVSKNYAVCLRKCMGVNTCLLLFFDGRCMSFIPSEEGVHQGDPLGAILFALSVHPVINRIQKNYSDMTILAYLDDIFVVGPGNQVDLIIDLKAELRSINLKIFNQKCEICTSHHLIIMTTAFPFQWHLLEATFMVFLLGVIDIFKQNVVRLLPQVRVSVLNCMP